MISFFVNTLLCAAVFYNIHHSLKLQDKPSRRFYKHYFVVLSLLLAIDNVFSFLLYRIPYYQFFKLSLLLWLSVPQSTGPHFVYNVYIRNIYKLFEGDIDTVINNFKEYAAQIKARYYEMVNTNKKGEVSISFKNHKSPALSANEHDSSEAEPSNSAVEDDDKEVKADK